MLQQASNPLLLPKTRRRARLLAQRSLQRKSKRDLRRNALPRRSVIRNLRRNGISLMRRPSSLELLKTFTSSLALSSTTPLLRRRLSSFNNSWLPLLLTLRNTKRFKITLTISLVVYLQVQWPLRSKDSRLWNSKSKSFVTRVAGSDL